MHKRGYKNVYGQDGSVEGKKEQEDATGKNGGRDTMDAVKYLREFARMCAEYSICKGCPIGDRECRIMEAQEPEKIVAIVEEWAKEHPAETRQSRFLKEFPNAMRTKEMAIRICPKCVDTGMECGKAGCEKCEQEYWSEGIYDE
jgi:uncharacterized ferredoxin-like protein